MDTWDKNLVIICWFYVQSCLFAHITDKIFFPVTGAKVEVLESPLVVGE